jgi:uncharacterized protein (DUF4415 family)
MKEVKSSEEIPQFANEAEEAEFWATHSLSEAFLTKMEPLPEDVLPPTRPRTQPISLRLDSDVLERVRALAEVKHKGYQTLMKEFVVERLYEEEKREGILSAGSLEEARPAPETTKTQEATKERNWQDEAFKFVEAHEELLNDEDLNFITSANLLNESATLLRDISREIKRVNSMKGARSKKMHRLIKGYERLKEFVDRAFAVHEAKFGLPERPEAEGTQELEEPEESKEERKLKERKLKELKEEQQVLDDVVIDARERFAT